MYLLPKEHPATKKILESPIQIPCDIYTDMPGECAKQQVDEFIRFVECHLNKLKKNTMQRCTTRVSKRYFFCCSRMKRQTKKHFFLCPYPRCPVINIKYIYYIFLYSTFNTTRLTHYIHIIAFD